MELLVYIFSHSLRIHVGMEFSSTAFLEFKLPIVDLIIL